MAVTAGVVNTTSPISRSRTSRIFIAAAAPAASGPLAAACEAVRAAWNNSIVMTRGAALVLGLRGPRRPARSRRADRWRRRQTSVGHSVLRVHPRPISRIARPDAAGARGLSAGRRGRSGARPFPPRSPRSTPAPTAPRTRCAPPGRPWPSTRRTPRRTGCSGRSSPPSSKGASRRDGRRPAPSRRSRRNRAPRAGPPEPAARRRPGVTLGRLYLAKRDFAKARDAARPVLEREPEQAEAAYLMAQA